MLYFSHYSFVHQTITESVKRLLKLNSMFDLLAYIYSNYSTSDFYFVIIVIKL